MRLFRQKFTVAICCTWAFPIPLTRLSLIIAIWILLSNHALELTRLLELVILFHSFHRWIDQQDNNTEIQLQKNKPWPVKGCMLQLSYHGQIDITSCYLGHLGKTIVLLEKRTVSLYKESSFPIINLHFRPPRSGRNCWSQCVLLWRFHRDTSQWHGGPCFITTRVIMLVIKFALICTIRKKFRTLC